MAQNIKRRCHSVRLRIDIPTTTNPPKQRIDRMFMTRKYAGRKKNGVAAFHVISMVVYMPTRTMALAHQAPTQPSRR